MSNLWQPNAKSRIILQRAWEHVQSVLYQVSLRWLFYRLLQDGLYHSKSDYHNRMSPLLADARKNFYGPWRPDTLADETRAIIYQGSGYDSPGSWYEVLAERLGVSLDKWATQPYYLCIMFEARAMAGQFQQYAPGVTLCPFGGDPSIPYKWDIAQHFSAVWRENMAPLSECSTLGMRTRRGIPSWKGP